MIIGSFQGTQPYVHGLIEIPRLGVAGTIDLLVDTGADVTCIHPKDGENLLIPFQTLRTPIRIGGIGGTSRRYSEPATLAFRESVGSPVHRYRIQATIATPEDADIRIPSVLGQDILRHWRTIHEPALNRIEFYVRTSDYTGL